jgi:hypothetical protein
MEIQMADLIARLKIWCKAEKLNFLKKFNFWSEANISNYGKAEKSDFFEKIGFPGRSQR